MDTEQRKAFLSWVIDEKCEGVARRLAEALQVSEATVSKWRKGSGMERENIQRVAELAGMTYDDALKRDWSRSVKLSPMFFQQTVSRTPTHQAAVPVELTQAIDWQIHEGHADPDAVALAAAKVLDESVMDGPLTWVQWANRIQGWLRKIPVNKG